MKKIIKVLVITGILLAFTVSSFAIGFDAETIYESVFVISAGRSIGSGFAIGNNVIITNYHVVENEKKVFVETYEGKSYPAEIYDSDSRLDIAILTVEGGNFVPLKIGDEGSVKIGDDIYTIGAPNSMAYTLTKGVISAKERMVSSQKYIQIDAAINHGNSGGPLLNDAGEVLGINTMKISDAEGIGLSIPISVAVSFIESCGVTFDSENNASVTEQEETAAEASEGATSETQQAAPEEPAEDIPDVEEEKDGKFFYINVSVAAAVGLFALIFIIVVYKKNSGKYIKKADPSERTDFEIEIEE